MDPVTMAIMAGVGLGLKGVSLFGGMDSSEKYNETQIREMQLQQAAENQRRQLAKLQHNRNQLQIYRNAQRMRAVSLTNATGQGASQGSGLQGGYGQIAGMTGTNLLAENQNYQIGENIFDINSQITNTRIQGAEYKQDMQFWQGLGNLGGDIFAAAGPTSSAMTQLWPGQQTTPRRA
jgi:hypothetical protein